MCARILVLTVGALLAAGSPLKASIIADCWIDCYTTYQNGVKAAHKLAALGDDMAEDLVRLELDFLECQIECMLQCPELFDNPEPIDFSIEGYEVGSIAIFAPGDPPFTISVPEIDVAGFEIERADFLLTHSDGATSSQIVIGSDTDGDDGFALTFDPWQLPIDDDKLIVLGAVLYDVNGIPVAADSLAGEVVPEPSSLSICGLLGLLACVWRWRKGRTEKG